MGEIFTSARTKKGGIRKVELLMNREDGQCFPKLGVWEKTHQSHHTADSKASIIGKLSSVLRLWVRFLPSRVQNGDVILINYRLPRCIPTFHAELYCFSALTGAKKKKNSRMS